MSNEYKDESFYLEYKPKYKVFHELMAKRLTNVLLVSSIYDSFMLEEDGRLSDQIYEEFQNLNLRTLPRITRVSSAKEALDLLQKKKYDLVITMRRVGDMDAFSFGSAVKKIRAIPVILLLNSVVEIKYLPSIENRGGIDRTFVWNGDSKIFVAIIKHLEDKLNADYDTKTGQVRVFIFVDDSVRFYSLLLPELYAEIMRQTHRLISEGTNDFQDLLKMRIRPKILLAETYEEAMGYYKKYEKYVMGIISDIEFPRKDELDKTAGFSFIAKVQEDWPNMPIILQSSKDSYRKKAEKSGCSFIHKRSHGMLWDIRKWLLECVGFGDFIFKLPNGREVGKAKDVIDFHKKLAKVPIDSLIYHGTNDHFSNWLRARGEFEIAQVLKPRKVSEFSKGELREFLLITINEIVLEKTRGIINDFSRNNYHPETLFLRLRPGSLGGKGRGIAFLMFLLNTFVAPKEFENVSIEIPQTIVIGTDEFEKFMSNNDLYDFALSEVPDQIIKDKFIAAKLSTKLKSDLKFLFKKLDGPLAIRSSSLSEDSAYQPFAGIFNTYMIPNKGSNLTKRLEQLFIAIKLVYASPFLKIAKSYADSIGQTVEESKMAVVIQKVVGNDHNNRFYPDFSGTAASYNYYPLGDNMKPEDRIAHIALGLGKIIVDGGAVLHFCPKYPKTNFYSTPDILLNQSQKDFFAIDMTKEEFDYTVDDPFLIQLDFDAAIQDKTLTQIADTYDFNNRMLRSGYFGEGSPVITFNKQLKLDTLPLADIITRILSLGERAMGCSIEVEFAGNFNKKSDEESKFYLLQIRPFLRQEAQLLEDFGTVEVEQIFIYSNQVSGNLVRKDIQDIVYVKQDSFNKMNTLDIVQELDKINADLIKNSIPYILIGFGRWGTADRFLGIPAKWNNLSGAKIIIEAELENFQVDFSQGSHFFQNIITSNIGYFHLKYHSQDHKLDWTWLEKQKVITETKYLKHIQVKSPLKIRIDAQKREGFIIKP
ncbi:MAG: PEP/pyruvate-binding domain-containing protein [Candidatus Heimdallarchaeota archaeon]